MDKEFTDRIGYIIDQIREAGYEPYAQLAGFVTTGDARYITRKGNARAMVGELDRDLLAKHLWQSDT